jgi:hypothetical protein
MCVEVMMEIRRARLRFSESNALITAPRRTDFDERLTEALP